MTTYMRRGALLAGLVLAVGACEQGLTDANEDPNAPTDVGAEFLLPQAIRAAVETSFGRMHLAHTSIWSHQTVQLQYPDEEQGVVRPGTIDGFWTGYYAGSLKDIDLVIDKGEDAGRPNVEGVGKIWQSWIFHQITDLWGDIPYSMALKGEEGETQPVYDPQQQVYAGLLQTLEEGAAMLVPGGAGFGAGDILYGNDFTKWKKFANSLRMRLAMRMSEVDAATARSEFQAAYQAGGFTSNADNAALRWPGAPYENLLYENWQGRDDDGVSRFMIETLKALGDPRLELYAEPAAEDGVFRGLQNNVEEPPLSIAAYSRIGNFWRANGAATPTELMTYAEVLFLQAEAAVRGWITGDAKALYEAGIRAAMNQYDGSSPANAPTDAEIDAYIASAPVAYSAAKAIEQINVQKWLSLYMNGNEAFANTRRIGFPVLTPGPDLTLSRLPARFYYPDVEQSLNNANMQAAVQRQGGGLDLVTPLWWEK